MTRHCHLALLASSISGLIALSAGEHDWPQFRGPGGLAVASEKATPPVEFSSTNQVAW